MPTYTIGDLIEKLPKHFYIKEAQISMVAINGSGAFQVWYDEVPKSNKSDGTIKKCSLQIALLGSKKSQRTIGGEK